MALSKWDEDSIKAKAKVVPHPSSTESTIPNLLYSYELLQGIVDIQDRDDDNYTKPEGYQSIQCSPYGLVDVQFAVQTKIHNKSLRKKASEEVSKLVREEIMHWLYLQRF